MDIQIARELTAHRVNGLNEALRIFVLDKPGSGGACHDYAVLVPMSERDQQLNHPDLVNWNWNEADRWSLDVTKDFIPYHLAIHDDVAVVVEQGVVLEFKDFFHVQRIKFQNGPVKEAGYNGSSHEALLAVLLDRMEGFQSGQFANPANAMALNKLEEARLWLNKRTMDRVARGVEGTHQK